MVRCAKTCVRAVPTFASTAVASSTFASPTFAPTAFASAFASPVSHADDPREVIVREALHQLGPAAGDPLDRLILMTISDTRTVLVSSGDTSLSL